MRISDWSSDVCSSDLPGVHLQEVEVEAFRIDDEFHRTGASVARSAAELQCRIGHPRLNLAGQPGRRAFLDHLLEAPLKRAVPFEEVHGVGAAEPRYEARRVGTKGVIPCLYCWSPYTYKKTTN